jgi:integrase
MKSTEGQEGKPAKRRQQGTGGLWKRGKYWSLKYYVHGRPVRESAKTTDEAVAKKLLKLRLADIAKGEFVDTRGLGYADLRAGYFLDYETNQRKSLERDREGNPITAAVARLDRYFSGLRADEITTDQIKRFQKAELERGLSAGSVNRSVSALRRMFNLATEEGRLRNVPHCPMLKEAAPRKGFFEPSDYRALAAALPDYARLPLALGFFCGMRKSEVLNLQWSQIDSHHNSITLYSGETKNDEGRTVPVPAQLLALLRERRAACPAGCPWVCWRLDRRGNAVKIEGLRKVWESRCVQVGLGEWVPVLDEKGQPLYDPPRPGRRNARAKPKMKYVGKTFHDLRRSAVRNLIRGGVPERVAMAISGHKTRSVFDRYNIVSGADLRAAARKMETYFDQNSGLGSGLEVGSVDPSAQERKPLIQ